MGGINHTWALNHPYHKVSLGNWWRFDHVWKPLSRKNESNEEKSHFGLCLKILSLWWCSWGVWETTSYTPMKLKMFVSVTGAPGFMSVRLCDQKSEIIAPYLPGTPTFFPRSFGALLRINRWVWSPLWTPIHFTNTRKSLEGKTVETVQPTNKTIWVMDTKWPADTATNTWQPQGPTTSSLDWQSLALSSGQMWHGSSSVLSL